MNIYCVGRNYVAHARELSNDMPTEPLIFMKPQSALVTGSNVSFTYPDFSNNIHFEGELVLKLGKGGKRITESEALACIEEISFGLDFTARDLQSKLKSKGHPWELAKAFDGAAVVGDFIPFKQDVEFSTWLNGTHAQHGQPSLMIFPFSKIISYLSKFFTLSSGDLIFTGTPAGVSSVKQGDVLEGMVNGEKLLKCTII